MSIQTITLHAVCVCVCVHKIAVCCLSMVFWLLCGLYLRKASLELEAKFNSGAPFWILSHAFWELDGIIKIVHHKCLDCLAYVVLVTFWRSLLTETVGWAWHRKTLRALITFCLGWQLVSFHVPESFVFLVYAENCILFCCGARADVLLVCYSSYCTVLLYSVVWGFS